MKKNIVQGGINQYPKSQWFDKDCSSKETKIKACLKRFRKSRKKEDYDFYAKRCKKYKRLLEKKKNVHIRRLS